MLVQILLQGPMGLQRLGAAEYSALPTGPVDAIPKLCKRIYRILELSGYARMDLRLGKNGKV